MHPLTTADVLMNAFSLALLVIAFEGILFIRIATRCLKLNRDTSRRKLATLSSKLDLWALGVLVLDDRRLKDQRLLHLSG